MLNCILLIDDSKGTNRYHEIIINDLKIAKHVQACYDGKEALDYLTNQGQYKSNGKEYPSPELIFLDINMPGMNGFEFLDAYQALSEEQKAKIVIVMLTTSLDENDRTKAESYSDVTDYQNKPFTDEYLLKLAEEIQNKHPQ